MRKTDSKAQKKIGKVTSRKQAVALAMSEAREAGGKVPTKPKGSRSRSRTR